jgi:hypothetical protein
MGGEHIFTASITTYINNLILTTMNNLFKEVLPKKARRVYRVENLNPQKNIFASMRASMDGHDYHVCLCLANRAIKTTFHSEVGALGQLEKYKELYKQK